jgi:guanylate kinase
MDIDVQGARQFLAAYPESVLVFLLPPSADALLTRLSSRQTEDPEEFLRRVRGARHELAEVSLYHYVVVNDQLDRAYAQVSAILDVESIRHARLPDLDRRVRTLIADLDREILSLTQTA